MMLSGCRISQQLLDCNPCQLGISSFNSNIHQCFTNRKAMAAPPPFRFPFCLSNALYSRSYLFGTNTFSYLFANETGDFSGISLVNSHNSGQHTSEAPVLSDCLSSAENGKSPSSEEVTSVAGGVVALGKFDALHLGHRELAIKASKIGVPYLLSFVGMAEILGWEPRPPIVAQCDRKRILSSWAPLCGNTVPKEFQVDFSKVRHLTSQQFVEKLAKELGVHGVVAGENYRFGYKAAGNAADLVQLCSGYGIRTTVIHNVMDRNQDSTAEGSTNSKERGQVSSTRVRYALSLGDMKYVSELLGRPHRLIMMVKNEGGFFIDKKRLSAPRSCLLNLPPREGLYKDCSLVLANENGIPCRVVIDTTDIHLECDELAHLNINVQSIELLSIDFCDCKVQLV